MTIQRTIGTDWYVFNGTRHNHLTSSNTNNNQLYHESRITTIKTKYNVIRNYVILSDIRN